jgi:SAM-dependent methyltransferase
MIRAKLYIDPEPLRAACAPDKYLVELAAHDQYHRFLARAAIGVYQRQARFLSGLLVDRFGRPSQRISVLDWGCGKGHATYLLRQQGLLVTSCDLQAGAGDSSFDLDTPIIDDHSIQVVPLLDDVRLPFGSADFDCVTSFGVLEHVRDDVASLKEIRRVLRPGGIFFVSFLPYYLSWTQRLARLRGYRYHDRLYSRRRLAELANETGFDVSRIWHGQFLPKSKLPHLSSVERFDRFLTDHTPLRYFATNLEAVLIAV